MTHFFDFKGWVALCALLVVIGLFFAVIHGRGDE